MTTEVIQNNPILKQTIEFSLAIVNYCEQLQAEKKIVIAQQLLKSGTSIGANSFEAQNAESKADFIHKFKIAAKEAEETQNWLIICDYSKNYPDCKHLIIQLEFIHKILGSILKTAKINKH
jgi:four helix bundle protein